MGSADLTAARRADDHGPEQLVDFLMGVTRHLELVENWSAELQDDGGPPAEGQLVEILLGLASFGRTWDHWIAQLPKPAEETPIEDDEAWVFR